jgi:hypothetical protein
MKICGCTQHEVITCSGFVASSILHLGNFTLTTVHPRKENPVSIDLEAGWVLSWSGGFEKENLLPLS